MEIFNWSLLLIRYKNKFTLKTENCLEAEGFLLTFADVQTNQRQVEEALPLSVGHLLCSLLFRYKRHMGVPSLGYIVMVYPCFPLIGIEQRVNGAPFLAPITFKDISK
jgi:hypothetical protein